MAKQKKIPLKVRLAKSRAGRLGGKARAKALSRRRRVEIGRMGGLAGAAARWPKWHTRRSIAEMILGGHS